MAITDTNIATIARTRYSCKAFDPTKTIPPEQFAQLAEVLRLAPSSVNGQPWYFFVASSAEGKQRVARATPGTYSYNTPKLLDCSHAVAICVRNELDDAWLDTLLAQEIADGRLAGDEAIAKQRDTRAYYVNLHRNDYQDVPQWLEKQAYIALGMLLQGAAVLGIDACPIEGFDAQALDEALGLQQQGLRGVVLVALGYRSDKDFNASLPKSRVAAEQVFTTL